jgi:hypothetical protein
LDILRTFDESLNVIVEIFGAEGLRKCIANGVSFSAAINTKALIDKKAKKGDKMCQEIIDRGGIDFVIIATKAGGGMKKIVEATKVGFSLDDIISRPFLISNLKK